MREFQFDFQDSTTRNYRCNRFNAKRRFAAIGFSTAKYRNQQKQQEKVKDWKAPEQYEYMQFNDSTDEQENDSVQPNSVTKQKQKNAFENFKLFGY